MFANCQRLAPQAPCNAGLVMRFGRSFAPDESRPCSPLNSVLERVSNLACRRDPYDLSTVDYRTMRHSTLRHLALHILYEAVPPLEPSPYPFSDEFDALLQMSLNLFP